MNRDQNASFRSSGLFIPERTIFPIQKTWMKKIEQEFWMEIASQNFSVIGQKIMLNSMNLDQQSVTFGTV